MNLTYKILPKRKVYLWLLGFISTVMVSCQTHEEEEQRQGFLKTEGQRIVNHKGENIILRGFDLGRNGFAYYNTDTANYYISTGGDRTGWNLGRTYRNDGVDISQGDDGNYHVDHFIETAWLQYSIDNSEAGNFNILLSAKSNDGYGLIGLAVDDQKISQEIPTSDHNPGLWDKVVF